MKFRVSTGAMVGNRNEGRISFSNPADSLFQRKLTEIKDRRDGKGSRTFGYAIRAENVTGSS